MHFSLSCLLLLIVGLWANVRALDIGAPPPALGAVNWVNRDGLSDFAEPTVLVWWSTSSPAADFAAEECTAAAHTFAQLRVLVLTCDEIDDVRGWLDDHEGVLDVPVGTVGRAAYDAWLGDVDLLPSAVLVESGVVRWRGEPGGLEQVLTRFTAGTLDAAFAQALSTHETALALLLKQELTEANRELLEIQILDETQALLALDPGHRNAIDLQLATAKHQQQPVLFRTTLAQVPVAALSPAQANDLAWDRAIDEALPYRNLDLALALAERAVTAAPTNAWYHDTLARVLYGLGRIEDAAAASETAVKLDPTTDELRETLDFYRGLLAMRSGNPRRP